MKAVFMGTPEFAVPSLESMVHAGVEVASVVTQPDRPAGRRQELTASPVKLKANELGLPVSQPGKIKDAATIEAVVRLRPDVIVVVGYGQIIPKAVFDAPPMGTVNVHASLLPKYRGAAPIQWAIANGEAVTGVTTMRIEAGLDTGDILLQMECAIGPEETASELASRLAPMGAGLLIETLRGLEAGAIRPRKQDAARATYAPVLKKDDGRVDWKMPASRIANRVRGFDPWPGVYTTFRGRSLRLRRARAVSGPAAAGPAGLVEIGHGSLLVRCGAGCLELIAVQPEGKRTMTAAEFINGYFPHPGELLGEKTP